MTLTTQHTANITHTFYHIHTNTLQHIHSTNKTHTVQHESQIKYATYSKERDFHSFPQNNAGNFKLILTLPLMIL